jgi:hypothetical protein
MKEFIRNRKPKIEVAKHQLRIGITQTWTESLYYEGWSIFQFVLISKVYPVLVPVERLQCLIDPPPPWVALNSNH